MKELLLEEINTSRLMLHPSAFPSLELLHKQIRKGDKSPVEKYNSPTFTLSRNQKIAYISDTNNDVNFFDGFEPDSIAVIPIIGTMFKYDSWWTGTGMDTIANFIRLADASSNIAGIILLVNTPGGTTQSIIQLEDALRNRTKPCIGYIDGNCFSGGTYAISLTDMIIAANPMCMIGNIGVYIELVNSDAYYEQSGIKFISIYPPESKYKNLAYTEAIDGNPDRLITENLSPYAQHFQDIIKANRPNLDLKVEGVLEGKDFYATDAINNGLIDQIGSFETAVELLNNLVQEKKTFYSSFNN